MITKERKELLNELMEVLGYKFKDLELLNLAFVHRSYLNECKDRIYEIFDEFKRYVNETNLRQI